MAVSKIPITLTYRKPGTQPPLFVAGTFSNPQWEAQEMQVTTGDDGEHTFSKPLHLPPGSKIQYKIRIGPGDWWVLNDDAPTVTDEAGNRNNVLIAPERDEAHADDEARNKDSINELADSSQTGVNMNGSTHSEVLPAPKPRGVDKLRERSEEELQHLTATPPEEVAETAAEVADTAETLDADQEDKDTNDRETTTVCLIDSFPDEEEDLDVQSELPPLFAHECLGGSDPVPEVVSPPVRRSSEARSGSVDYNVDQYDLNDPTLERWPSDLNAIMDAVRRVESSRDEDQTYVLGSPISPIITSRRASKIEDDIALSPESPSPVTATKLDVPTRKQSHGSMVSNRSLTSLASIVEEDHRRIEEEEYDEEAVEDLRPSPVVRLPSPAVKVTPDLLRSPASDDDEGVVLKSSRSDLDVKSDTDTPAAALELPERGTSKSQPSPPVQQDQPSAGAPPPDEMDELDDDGADGNIGQRAAPQGEDSADGQLRRRNLSNDRAVASSSAQGAKNADSSNWLQAFFRVLFVDWIGGFVRQIFHGNRK
ncbi:hypothetical protein D7B24_005831 [Verticillium nonalfalfae]|uniref:AMP-activated protein kinase glycogen-binding domain-containing protein n=1 Tax=Verticillium nonalfalfae TaxID=1051616 RepID=A0A3M9YAE0_9PEZI|nr:uncharacterized protein D7B24_005831 [Verticillium nonalfalfae]RNJ57483.1 hypothetical protein D7B24_005831 [Verticillium nonalfalfae]